VSRQPCLPARYRRKPPNSRLSSTDMLPKSSRLSGTSEIPSETRRSTCQAPISEPRYCTEPEQLPVDGKDPMMEFSKVDLPAPLPPMTVALLPRVTAVLAPTTAVTLP